MYFTTAGSRETIWPVKLIKVPWWLWLLSVQRWWFFYCLFIVFVASIVCGVFVLGSCLVMQFFLSFIVLQSSHWERESWFAFFRGILNV